MIGLLIAVIYLSFISLGLPDAVLGSAWPFIIEEFGVTVSSMGIVTIIISAGTIFSSLKSNYLIIKVGVFKIVVASIFITAISLLGFAFSNSFLMLCLLAIPYGLGAGCIDAALNNYVAVNFESKHMSWLHCMWGVGATTGPYVMGRVLTNNLSFKGGYVILFVIQLIIALIVLFSKNAWKLKSNDKNSEEKVILSLKEIFKIKGVLQIAIAFFCFCAIEHTTGLWASSYLVYNRGVDASVAAGFTALFYLGITIGRGVNGFIAMKYNDKQMIRAGFFIMAVGIIVLMLPFSNTFAFVGLALIGLGSSPVYPCIIHSTPENFGKTNSQAITGVQMASAYTGTLFMPALFGVLGKYISFDLYSLYIGFILIIMIVMYEKLLKKVK